MVTIVVPSFPPEEIGGMELQAMKLSELLNANIVTKKYRNPALKEKIIGEIPYIKTPFRILNYILYTFIFIIKLQFIITDEKIISFMLSPSGISSVIKSRFNKRIKVFSWIRGGDWYFLKRNPLGRWIVSYTIKNSTAIICQTERIKKEVEREFNIKPYVIGNGVEIPELKKNKRKKIIFVGNLTKRKGVKYLIEAMRKMPNEELVILYQHGDQYEKLKEQSPENVSFVRCPHEELEKYYLEAKALVLPAIDGEGLPNVILEAYSYGVPVIATDIAGIPDVVEDGKTGIIVKPKNADDIVRAVKKITPEMGMEGRKIAEKYSWKNIVKKVKSLLKKFD